MPSPAASAITPDHAARARRAGVAAILFGALLWSTGGACIKLLMGPIGWSPFLVSAGRALFAAATFAIVVRGRVRLPSREHARWFWIGALSYCYVVTSFVFATKLTTAANAIILQYTFTLWMLLLSGALLGERAHWREFVALGTGFAGIVFCVRGGLAQAREGGWLSTQTLGDLLSLSSGFAFAISTIAMRKFAKDDGTWLDDERVGIRFLCVGNVLTAIVGCIGGAATGWTVPTADPPGVFMVAFGVLLLVWLGAGQLGGGYLFVQRGLRHVPAIQGSVLMLAEPILNPVWVALFIREIPDSGTLIGAALVIVGMIIGSTGKREAKV